MTDVFLYSVPSDTNPNDVRLVDPTQAASTGTISVSAAQTLADITQSASVSVVIAASAGQTLADLTQAANISIRLAVSASQTLADISQTATVTVPVGVTAPQTLDTIAQSASVAISVAVSAAQTLEDLAQSAAVELVAGAITVSAAQTFDDITQSAALHLVREQASADDDHDYWRSHKAKQAKKRAEERARQADIEAWLAGLDALPVVKKPVRIRKVPAFVTHKPEPSPVLAAIPQQLVLELPPAAPRRSQAVISAVAAYRASQRPVVADAVAAYRKSKSGPVIAFRRSKRPIIADAIAAYRRSRAA